MRFSEEGPIIPDELIAEQERGRVLFVCGAGVSMTVGLPSFGKLVSGTYGRLGEDWRMHPAEHAVMSPDGILRGQFDQGLNSLERRLAAGNPRNARLIQGRIRRAVEEELSVSDIADVSAHRVLLSLSVGADGMPRLLTTNFETLFERASTMAGRPRLPSFAGPSMPGPGSAAFEGVLHLHGRIADTYLGLDGTDLVLTSSEFGEAYLRSGWAARYVYDLSRAYVLVLVGYSADDPPMRYLLQVLEADRARYPDLKPVYAFAPAKEGEEGLQTALWCAKGIEPIVYREKPGDDHSSLYDTLDAWAGYAAGPSAWRERRLRELTAVGPESAGEHVLPEICALLSHADAPRLLADVGPSAAWFGPLMGHSSFSGRGDVLAPWVCRSFGDPAMLGACLAGACQDAAFYEHLGRVLDFGRIEPEPTLARGWRITIAARLDGFDLQRAQRYQFVVRRVKALDIDRHVRDAVIEVVRPRLEVSIPLRPSSEAHSRDTAPRSLEDLVHVRFSSEGYPTVREILLDWPRVLRHELDLLQAADRALAEALDQARDSGHLDRIDLASLDVLSVSAGEGDELGHGFLPTTRMVAMLWDRVASRDGPRARGLATAWGVSDYLLHRRLHLHALADAAFGVDAIVPALEGLDDRVFWASEARREITRLVQARWSDLPEPQRSWIEAKMRLGPPRRLARDATVRDDEWGVVRDYALFQLLDPVRSAGGTLAPETLAELEGIRSRHPDFEPRGCEDDEVRSATIMTPRGHPERLSDAADEVLLSRALRLQETDWRGEGDVWRLLCAADPHRALRALVSTSDDGDRRRPEAVSALLAASGKVDDDELAAGISELLSELPADAIRISTSVIAAWVRERADLARAADTRPSSGMFALCDHVAGAVFGSITPAPFAGAWPERPMDAALDCAGGHVALALVALLGAGRFERDGGFGEAIRRSLDAIVDADGHDGLAARVILVGDLAFLDDVDPHWTAGRLLPRLGGNSAEAAVLWRVRAGRRIGRARLFNALKPAFMHEVARPDLGLAQSAGLAANLMQAASWKLNPAAHDLDLTFQEVRNLLATSTTAIRTAAARTLFLWMDPKKATDFDGATRWRLEVGPFFEKVWPLDSKTREAGSSRFLCLMTVKCGNAFPEAVEAVEPFIVSWGSVGIDAELAHASADQETIARHPLAYLRLLSAAIDAETHGPPMDLGVILERVAAEMPEAKHERAYLRLDAIRRKADS